MLVYRKVIDGKWSVGHGFHSFKLLPMVDPVDTVDKMDPFMGTLGK